MSTEHVHPVQRVPELQATEEGIHLDFERSFTRCRELIRQPFGVDNFRLDATNRGAFPLRLFEEPTDQTPYERTIMGYIPIAARVVADRFQESGLRPDVDELIHAVGVESTRAAARLANAAPEKSYETSSAMFDWGLRMIQDMQLGKTISSLSATHAVESQFRRFFSRELDRQPLPRTVTISDPDFIKPERHLSPEKLAEIEESVFVRTESALDPTNVSAYTGVRHAFRFARFRHERQDHVGSDPIDLHLLQLMTCALDDPNMNTSISLLEKVLTTAALHDVFEDGLATLEEIALLFGKDTASSVDALSRVDKEGHKRPDGVYYGNLYGQPEHIRLLKGWDRWLNLRKWKVELETSTLSRLYRGEEERAREAYVKETDDFIYTLVGDHPLRGKIKQAADELMAA